MIIFNDGVHPELVELINRTIKMGVAGKCSQFIYNIDVYLREAPTAMKYYTQDGYNALVGVDSKAKFDVTSLPPMYVAIMGMLSKHVFVGIDMTKEGYPSALYTRSIGCIKYLADNGMLSREVKDVNKVISALTSNKTALGFEDDSFLVIRLDVASFVGGKVQFKLVVPRTRLKIGAGKDFVFIPIDFMHKAADIFNALGRNNIFKFTKTSVTGQKTHIATCNPDIVKQVYVGFPENLIDSKLKKVVCGYDDVKLRYSCYDLEASIYSMGEASFRPEMLDVFVKSDMSAICRDVHNVNYDHLYGVFKTKVRGMRLADYANFKLFDTSSFPTVDKKAEALITWGESLDSKDLFTIMQSNPNIFGNLNSALSARAKSSPKVLKDLKTIDGVYTVDEIKDLMSKGVVKITAVSKAGKVYERYCSNNEDVLKRFLGADYVKKFESTKARLKAMKDEISANGIKDKRTLENLLVEYDLLAVVDSRELVRFPVMALENAIENMKSKAPMADGSFVYRKITATDSTDFYGQVNIKNIMAIEFAPYNASASKN